MDRFKEQPQPPAMTEASTARPLRSLVFLRKIN